MALTFDGSVSNYVEKAITFSANTGTLMAWVKIITDPDAYQSIFITNITDNNQVNLYTAVDGTTIRIYTGASNNSVGGKNLTVGRWYHLAMTWDGTSVKAYVDGVLDMTYTAASSTWDIVRLGFDVDYWGDSFNGAMAHVKAWNATLTLEEIAAEKNVITAVKTANLVGEWPTPSGSTRVNDTSGNGNHFTAVGTITDTANPLADNSPTIIPGWTTAQRTGNGTSIDVSVPTYTAGDEIYVVYESDGDGDVATLAQGSGSAWTAQYDNVALTGGVGVVSVWHRTATTEGTTYSITNTVSERAVVTAFVIKNFGGINATATTSSGTVTTISSPSLTSTVASCLRVTIYGTYREETTVGFFEGHAKGPEVYYASAGTISVQQKMLPAATTDASSNITQSQSGAWSVMSFAVAPAVAVTNKSVTDTASGSDSVTVNTGAVSKSRQDFARGVESLRILKSPYYVNHASSTSGPGVTSRTCSVPTGTQDGDIMLAIVIVELASGSVTAHANWGTPILNTPLGTRTHTQQVYARIASSEPADYTFSWASCECAVVIVTFRGGILPTQYQAQVNNSATANVTGPDITTTIDNSLCVWIGSIMYGTTFTPPGGTEIFDIRTSTASTNLAVSAAVFVQVTAGATGAPVGTAANADYNIGTQVIIPPAFKSILLGDAPVGNDTITVTDAGSVFNKSVTDSASGTDGTPALAVSFGIAESASGADSFGTRSARFTGTDSAVATDILAILARLVGTDTLTGSDSLTAQARFTRTDTWSASDALSVHAQLSRTDNATGSDAVTGMTNRFTSTDAASFNDLITQVANLFNQSDAVTSSDVIAALTAAAVVSDQASTVEGAVASAMVTLGDIFNGSDAVSIFTATLKTVLESGAFGDLLNITVAPIQVVDSNSISEGIAISTVTAVFDSSTGTTSGITMLVSCPVADYINSIDGTQVNVTLLVPDGILTADVVALVLDTMKQVLELAHGSDNLAVSTRTALSESLSSVDLTSVTVNLNLAETGSLSDLLLISSYFVLTDIAGLSEHVGLQVQAKVADAMQGMMVLTGISNLLEVSDLASFLDVSLAYDSATRIVTITMKLRTNRMDFEVRQHSAEFTLAQSKAEFLMAQASMEFALRQEASTFSIQGEQSDE